MEKRCLNKVRFLACGFLFTCSNFTLIFTVSSIFGSDFFLNGFPNPFMVHYTPIYLFEINFHFSLVVFCSHVAFSHWFSVFLKILCTWFFLNGFPNSLIVHFRSGIFCSQWKFFELYFRTCPAMFLKYKENFNCIGALCFFLRCVHTFFNDFDLSKRDKQVKY